MDNNPMSSDVASELVTLFKKAESRIKILEFLYEEGLFYHPVNQLRYAGHHIIHIMDATVDQDEKEKHYKRAISHCQRAIYDASEMAIVFCLTEVNRFKQDYYTVEVTPTVSNYLDIIHDVRKAQALITTNHEKREKKYEECDALFEILKSHVDRLDDARPELNKRLSRQRKIMFVAVITLIVTIVGIIVA